MNKMKYNVKNQGKFDNFEKQYSIIQTQFQNPYTTFKTAYKPSSYLQTQLQDNEKPSNLKVEEEQKEQRNSARKEKLMELYQKEKEEQKEALRKVKETIEIE